MKAFKNFIHLQTFSLSLLGRTLVCISLSLCCSLSGSAQTAYHNYIAKYADVAVEQMRKYKIPASITLAQGLLESGAGQSRLATKANNHFGIKKGSGWTGPTISHNDDRRGEKFRKYSSALESYEDHSKFLVNGMRYSALFQLDIDDYKGWAKGLKKAGYATNPKYAKELIDIIERFQLYKYDKLKPVKVEQPKPQLTVAIPAPQQRPATLQTIQSQELTLRTCNENYYVVARSGDTYKSIGNIFCLSQRKLRKYNEVDKDYELRPGDIVYIKKKQKKAHKSLKGKRHTIKAGESIYSIAQQYGMRVETLYKINRIPDNYTPSVGDTLLIRK